MIASCLTLCAAVWPRTAVGEETPLPAPTTAIATPGLPVTEIELEGEIDLPTEKEKVEIAKPEPLHETVHEPESALAEAPAIYEVQPVPEAEPIPELPPAQTVTNPQPGDMVYVEGFGWLECQGPGKVTYAEDMYEDGNKIGSMG